MEIPLFPLSSVLYPGGRMSLKIFEQRYLELVRSCLKEDSGFGLVLITEGYEVAQPGKGMPALGKLGCYARIVDWDSLPNALLGITIEGRERFVLSSAQAEANKLVMGEIEMLAELPPEPLLPQWDSLEEVLTSLEQHPHVQRLGFKADHSNAWEVGHTLAQLLPVEEDTKYQLLCEDNIEVFMEELDALLNEMGGVSFPA